MDAIHVALRDKSLVAEAGAPVLMKPRVALCWVLLIGFAGMVFPVANIGNIAALGVAASVAAVGGFGAPDACGGGRHDRSATRPPTSATAS